MANMNWEMCQSCSHKVLHMSEIDKDTKKVKKKANIYCPILDETLEINLCPHGLEKQKK